MHFPIAHNFLYYRLYNFSHIKRKIIIWAILNSTEISYYKDQHLGAAGKMQWKFWCWIHTEEIINQTVIYSTLHLPTWNGQKLPIFFGRKRPILIKNDRNNISPNVAFWCQKSYFHGENPSYRFYFYFDRPSKLNRLII